MCAAAMPSRAAMGLRILAIAGGVPPAEAAPAADLRLPDLRQLPPSQVQVRAAPEGRVVLAFRSAVANVGRGPLLVRGERGRGEATMRADQLIRRDGGPPLVRRGVGRIAFVPGGHNHWHLAGFERFELRDPATGRRVARDHKTGFCLGDRFVVRPPVPCASADPVISHNCSRGSPGIRGVTMGITVGWADDYKAFLEDQFVDITAVRPGRYVLVHRADPARRLRVGDRRDDVASALVALRRRAGDALPSAVVLASCPGSDGSPGRPCRP